jgi:ribokinase
VVLAQNEVPVESVAAAFTAAREVGAMLTILNAAPAEPAALALFGLTDLLVVNEHELARYAALAGITGANEAALARALLSAARARLGWRWWLHWARGVVSPSGATAR